MIGPDLDFHRGRNARIGFDARYINDRYHGIGRYAFRLLEALACEAPQYTFVIFRGKGADSRFDWKSLTSRPNVELRAGPWPLYWPQEQMLWLRIFRQARLDLFHTPYFVAPLLTRASLLPVIVTVHDLIFDRYPAYMPKAWARPYYGLLMRLGMRRACQVVTVSQSTASDLSLYYQTPPQKITVIPEGVDPDFHPAADIIPTKQLRQEYNLAHPFILTVGARRPHKNMSRLVQAFAKIAPDSEHELVFVGPADPRFPDEARLTARQQGLGNRARFLDWVPEKDLPGLYSMADLVVLPSLIEGFGLPALEAMACGAPVLAADNSSLPEVIGEAGLLVDPLDVNAISSAIHCLLEDRALRQSLSTSGIRRAASFAWKRAARQMIALYEKILA